MINIIGIFTGQRIGGSDSGVPENAVLYEDSNPVTYEDNDYVLYET